MHNRDNLKRAALLLIDLGKAQSIEEAEEILSRYRITVAVGQNAANSESGQACLLTIVNSGIRACVGGVRVIGIRGDEDVLTPLASEANLGGALRGLGGEIGSELFEGTPIIVLGDYQGDLHGETIIRATYEGFSGGLVPKEEGFHLAEDSSFPPSAIFAGALSVSECFAALLGDNILAGQRSLGLSLIDPQANWRTPITAKDIYLPEDLWILGLGHLGQAYAWTLASLPYPSDQKPCIYIQDFDVATQANLSTSVLTHSENIGELKTRYTAKWLEERGFRTRLVERRFADDFRRLHNEPNILLCGVDNLPTRRLLENPGFTLVVDAGLGESAADYDGFNLHVFTNKGRAANAFPETGPSRNPDQRAAKNQAAYDSLGKDQCGIYWAADIAVGVPFVGVAVSCLVISSVIRAIMGEVLLDTVTGSMKSLDLIDFYSEGTIIRNPGFILPQESPGFDGSKPSLTR